MHVTSAGVIGTWWFDPAEASSFCSTAISVSILLVHVLQFLPIFFFV